MGKGELRLEEWVSGWTVNFSHGREYQAGVMGLESDKQFLWGKGNQVGVVGLKSEGALYWLTEKVGLSNRQYLHP